MGRIVWALLAGILTWAAIGHLPGAIAEEPWEAAARQAEEQQDRELDDARRRGTTGRLVQQYASRLSRQPSALNHYLLGRALYYDGDVAGAERQLRRTLQMEPRFWPARLRLALLELKRERVTEAERYVQEVLRQHPKEPDALRLLAQIHLDAKNWDRALQVLDLLLTLEPTDESVRRNIAFVLMAKEDWERALKELRVLRGRYSRDPAVRWYYANALFHTEDHKKAVLEFEGLVRLDRSDVRSLEMLRRCYIHLQDWKSLEKTLERMLPLVPEEEFKKNIRDMLAQLKEGPPQPGEVPEGMDGEWAENTWLALVERCMHPTDVSLRREALQTYYGADFPRIPYVLVSRIHPNRETDTVCRSWLLRIIGSMQNPQLAQVTAYALFDPEASVRAVAAETLGEIGTPSGILYLMPVLLGRVIGPTPSESLVDELNRARGAMILLTERRDTLGGEDSWVPAERLAEMRKDWMEWLASPEGVYHRLRAIRDLEAQGDLYPERVLVEDVSDPNVEIAKAAYGLLLRRSKMPSEEEVGVKMWPIFPRFGPDELTAEGLEPVRAAVSAWWEEFRKAEAAAPRSSGSE